MRYQACDEASGDDKAAILETILSEAQGLIEDIEKTPLPSQPNLSEPVDPGFVSSFYIYPAAQAYAYAPFLSAIETHLDIPFVIA